jgi:hypothetical protein
VRENPFFNLFPTPPPSLLPLLPLRRVTAALSLSLSLPLFPAACPPLVSPFPSTFPSRRPFAEGLLSSPPRASAGREDPVFPSANMRAHARNLRSTSGRLPPTIGRKGERFTDPYELLTLGGESPFPRSIKS